MTGMPERIWAALRGAAHPWFESSGDDLTEYIRIDKYTSLEAARDIYIQHDTESCGAVLDLTEQVEQLQALLDIAICPNTPSCDGEGNIAVEGPVMNEFSAEHCQWCHEAGRCCIPAQQQEPG